MGHERLYGGTAQRNQDDRNENQSPKNEEHQDGENALFNPTTKSQAFITDEVCIHISEAIEDGHNTTRAEHQAHHHTDRKQAIMRLIHDAIDGICHIVKRS